MITIEENASLLDAVKMMKEKHIGDIVVVGRSQNNIQLKGIITDRDIALSATDDQPLSKKLVGAFMTRNLHVLNGSDGVNTATEFMRENSVRRLPIVDDDGRLLGIVTADDLIQMLARELSALADIADRQVIREGMPRTVERVSNSTVREMTTH
jgi:CBS domain-containing protein